MGEGLMGACSHSYIHMTNPEAALASQPFFIGTPLTITSFFVEEKKRKNPKNLG